MLALRAVFLIAVNHLRVHYDYGVVLPYPVSFFFPPICFASVLSLVRLAMNWITMFADLTEAIYGTSWRARPRAGQNAELLLLVGMW